MPTPADEVGLVGGVDVAHAALPHSRSTSSRASSKSFPCSMTVAPQARISAFLPGLFPSGTTSVHGTPARAAA